MTPEQKQAEKVGTQQDVKRRHRRAEKMEDAELLAVEADGLYLLNCHGPRERHREELAQTITKTAVAFRIGQKQKSLWAGDFNEEPNDMVTHTLEQFGVEVVDDEKPAASTGFSSKQKLLRLGGKNG